jgi:hypothetical protein
MLIARQVLKHLCLAAVVATLVSCSGPTIDPNEPQTAAAKARQEAERNGETTKGKNWGGWRYQGDRESCFYVVERRCFKTEAAACRAAKCQTPTKCNVDGAGPATVACK